METNNMTVDEIEKRLIDIITDTDFFSLTLDKSKIGPGTSIIKDLSLDSIQLLEYLVAIENNMNLNLDYQDLSVEVFESFSSLAGYFHKKLKAKSGEN